MDAEMTFDQLIAEYERIGLTDPKKGMTMEEIAEKWGCAVSTARDRIRRSCKELGLTIYCTKVKRKTMSGGTTFVPSYYIEPSVKKVKK